MVGQGIGEALGMLYIMAIAGAIAVVLLFGFGCYKTYDHFYGDEIIESKTIITPTIKLTINENKVDTLYVYTLKK